MQGLYEFIRECLAATEILAQRQQGLTLARIREAIPYAAPGLEPEHVDNIVKLVTEVLLQSKQVVQISNALFHVSLAPVIERLIAQRYASNSEGLN